MNNPRYSPEFKDEALGVWLQRVGRIKGMAASQMDRSEGSPETSQGSSQPNQKIADVARGCITG
ncbi:hypothetical protein [uncultured Porticoccus sp.]|uniref:hypothetical protein n=1 Tax=uncultured Porticoccus sp. TaxID=1256050 RepID=UPI0030DB098E